MMAIIDFYKWWYGAGWVSRVRRTGEHVQQWYEYFSIGLLLRTLFLPWRQIIPEAQHADPIRAKIDATIGVMVSRFVGFWVRLLTIITGIFVMIFVVLVNIVIFIVWPLLPLSPLLFVLSERSI